jgi:hypothetical protein
MPGCRVDSRPGVREGPEDEHGEERDPGSGDHGQGSRDQEGPPHGLRSSHRPSEAVEMTGFEPATPWLQTRCSTTELHPRRRV